jgi:hypothetical protein
VEVTASVRLAGPPTRSGPGRSLSSERRPATCLRSSASFGGGGAHPTGSRRWPLGLPAALRRTVRTLMRSAARMRSIFDPPPSGGTRPLVARVAGSRSAGVDASCFSASGARSSCRPSRGRAPRVRGCSRILGPGAGLMAGHTHRRRGALCWLFMAGSGARRVTIQIQMQGVFHQPRPGDVTVDFRVVTKPRGTRRRGGKSCPASAFGRFEGRRAGSAHPSRRVAPSLRRSEDRSGQSRPGTRSLAAEGDGSNIADAREPRFSRALSGQTAVTVGVSERPPSGRSRCGRSSRIPGGPTVRAPSVVRLKSLSDVTRRAESRLGRALVAFDVHRPCSPWVLEPWGRRDPPANIVNREAPVGSRLPRLRDRGLRR